MSLKVQRIIEIPTAQKHDLLGLCLIAYRFVIISALKKCSQKRGLRSFLKESDFEAFQHLVSTLNPCFYVPALGRFLADLLLELGLEEELPPPADTGEAAL